MIAIQTRTDTHEIEILTDEDGDRTYLRVEMFSPFRTLRCDEEFPNARMASAVLRDEVGLGPAKEMLDMGGLPRTHALWDLNHSDLWEPENGPVP